MYYALRDMDSDGILYVVATPIGNLKDITLRAIEILREVDFVVAESSARALKLFNHFEIKKSIISINSYNEERKAKSIAEQLWRGKTCALITGAGTPCISDPGNFIVRACYEMGVTVRAVPGPSAVISAVSISGLFAAHFMFFGFLPLKKGKQRKVLREFSTLPYPIVFYESPRRVAETLKTIYEVLGNRQTVVLKEITKVYESVLRGDLEELIRIFPEGEIKGEFVIIVEGKLKNMPCDPISVDY